MLLRSVIPLSFKSEKLPNPSTGRWFSCCDPQLKKLQLWQQFTCMLIIFLLFVTTLHQSHNKKYHLWYLQSQNLHCPWIRLTICILTSINQSRGILNSYIVFTWTTSQISKQKLVTTNSELKMFSAMWLQELHFNIADVKINYTIT